MTDNELFKAVTLKVCGTLNLAGGLGDVLPVLRKVVPVDEIRVNILDTSIHAVRTVVIVNSRETRDLFASPLVLDVPPDAEAQLRGDELDDIRIVGGIEQDPTTASLRSEYFADEPESSLLIMRLILDNRRTGALLLRAYGTDRYRQEHIDSMRQLNEPFAIALSNALAHREIVRLKDSLAEENRALSRESRPPVNEIVGASFGLAEVMGLVKQVAPLESTVLLLGETGVGKEVVADAVHEASPRHEGPMVKVNCGGIPESLIDSELFGHEKGAFTGAVTGKTGTFERARDGTLFLDEVGELPRSAQLRLLRVLQSRTFQRVGGTTPITTNARIIAATHRDLAQCVEEGTFRQDLWYRINVFPITIPPLRERRQDIPALVSHMIEKKSREMGIYPPPPVSQGAMGRLMDRAWPGNVRQLQNTVEREIIIHRDGPLPFREGPTRRVRAAEEDRDTTPARLDDVVSKHIRRALAYTGGKVGGQGGAADILGVNPSTLRNRMKRLAIPYGRQ